MKKTLSFLVACFVCIGVADAAVRAVNSGTRGTTSTQPIDTSSRNATTQSTTRSATVSSRNAQNDSVNVVSRENVSYTRNLARKPGLTSRAAVRTTTTQPTSRTTVSRATTTQTNVSRAAVQSQTFGAGYNSCRDAYFTCMDQFCATANETYRRCICSSRLSEIKKKQSALGDAADQIQNFKDLNIEVIPKTAAEVNAMLNASEGEYAAAKAKDTSDSAKKLAGISAVLNNTKTKSLSTSGTLDIAGDINAIWATTDLASGVNIANLTGEALYNAVHSQCADLVAEKCESKATLNMVISAYGMYIENDCTLLSNALANQKTNTNAAIRETEREMQNARLENYNAHNSTSINDCVAKVRANITGDNACGPDYVHCLDISGLYLNKVTGEPIYTADFYKLETMVSLSGDILTNQTNRLLVAELNRKRSFAENSLSTCQDLADDVWDEFMRQAITEIYQGQQSRIRQVKDECLDVVNKCYDKQTQSLRDFSNTNERLLLGSRLELSEQLCQEKLNACSNLYGGGTDGLQILVDTMYNITSQKIAQNCAEALKEYAVNICSVPKSDTVHSYPYACRVYAPGEQMYATQWKCQNQSLAKMIYETKSSENTNEEESYDYSEYEPQSALYTSAYYCTNNVKYTSCKPGYFLSSCGSLTNTDAPIPQKGTFCMACPSSLTCNGGTACPTSITYAIEYASDCSDYVGSLYQKMVNYAIQVCMRPSETENPTGDTTPISDQVLQDVNTTVDSIRIAMSESLGAECERLGGTWITTQYDQENAQGTLFDTFYNETGANKKWGYCIEKQE